MFRTVFATCSRCGTKFHHACSVSSHQQHAEMSFCFYCGTQTVRNLVQPVGLAVYEENNRRWRQQSSQPFVPSESEDTALYVNVAAAAYGATFPTPVPLSQALYQLREQWENVSSDSC